MIECSDAVKICIDYHNKGFGNTFDEIVFDKLILYPALFCGSPQEEDIFSIIKISKSDEHKSTALNNALFNFIAYQDLLRQKNTSIENIKNSNGVPNPRKVKISEKE